EVEAVERARHQDQRYNPRTYLRHDHARVPECWVRYGDRRRIGTARLAHEPQGVDHGWQRIGRSRLAGTTPSARPYPFGFQREAGNRFQRLDHQHVGCGARGTPDTQGTARVAFWLHYLGRRDRGYQVRYGERHGRHTSLAGKDEGVPETGKAEAARLW